MVKFTALVAMISLAVLCSAAPSDNSSLKPFSFEEWARGIAENPSGDNLTPEEAIAAYNATIAASKLESRAADPEVGCNKLDDFAPCFAPDAVKCINYLARKGQNACRTGRDGTSVFCTASTCQIVATGNQFASAACNDVAITGGRIMDSCTRGNNVQGSRVCVNQPNAFQVNILGPKK